jgi:hypothetical protein
VDRIICGSILGTATASNERYSYPSKIIVPVTAYNFIHEGGIGNRGVSSYTSSIALRVSFDAGAKASWDLDLPDIENSRHRRPSNTNSIEIGYLNNVPVPISIPPEHLISAVRALYLHHAYAESYTEEGDEVVYAMPEDDKESGIQISMEEANQIVGLLKELYLVGSTASDIKRRLTSNQYPFQIVANLAGDFVLQVPTKAGRIHKAVARGCGINVVELGVTDSWRWKSEGRKQPNVYNFHGAVPYYHMR